MLEPWGEVAHGAGDLGVDGIMLAARWRGVMGFIQDEQRAAAEGPQPVAQWSCIGFVDEQAVRHQESDMRTPRIDAEAARTPHLLHVFLVENHEGQTEAGVQFLLPLQEHGRGAGHDDLAHLLAQQQLAGNEPGFNRLAQADVIGDEEVDPWEHERFAQRFKLVGVQANAGAEGRLKQAWIRCRDAVPAQRMQVRGKQRGLVEPPLGHRRPRLAREDFRIEFVLPEYVKRLALIVVVDAGQPHQRALASGRRRDNILDEVKPLSHTGDVSRGRDRQRVSHEGLSNAQVYKGHVCERHHATF